MTEKVKITQEQADAIENMIKVHSDIKEIEKIHKILIREKLERGWADVNFRKANDIPDFDFIDALRIGYKIGPEPLKVGDWAKATHEKIGTFIGKITKIDYTDNGVKRVWASWNAQHGQSAIDYEDLEKCTPEEIETMKERRFWNHRVRRKVGEFRDGDLGEHVNGVEHSGSQEYLSNWYKCGKLKGFYPAESFVSFEEVESND